MLQLVWNIVLITLFMSGSLITIIKNFLVSFELSSRVDVWLTFYGQHRYRRVLHFTKAAILQLDVLSASFFEGFRRKVFQKFAGFS